MHNLRGYPFRVKRTPNKALVTCERGLWDL